jgi:hypothetical protein
MSKVHLLVFAVALAAGPPTWAEEIPAVEPSERYGAVVSVFSGDIHIPTGVRQNGDVVCIGATVTIDGEVTGDVAVVLGRLVNRGTIGGSVSGVLTDQSHTDARIGGQLVSVLGSTDLVNSEVAEESISVLGDFRHDGLSSLPSIDFGRLRGFIPSLESILLWFRLLRLVAVFALLLLLAAFAPDRIAVISEEAPLRYVMAFFVGLAGYLGVLIAHSLLMLTVVGLPLAIAAFWVLKWLGIAAIFHAVGRGLGRAMGREMSLLGAVLLAFGLYVVVTLAPTPFGLLGIAISILLATAFFFLVEIPALGLVILTRCGSRSAARAAIAPRIPAAPAPVAGPAPPA